MRNRLIESAGIGLIAATLTFGGCGDSSPPPANPPVAAPDLSPESTAPALSETPPPLREPDPQTTAAPPATRVQPSAEPNADDAAGQDEPTPVASPAADASDSRVAVFEGLTAPKPVTWIAQPISSQRSMMVAAEYTVPGRDGFDQARLTIYRNIGGTPEENILRWKQGQFRGADQSAVEPIVDRFEVDGMSVVFAEFSGEYKGMGAVNFSRDHTLLAAVIPDAPAGQIILYFVGPSGTVEPNREAFMEMVRNIRKVEAQK